MEKPETKEDIREIIEEDAPAPTFTNKQYTSSTLENEELKPSILYNQPPTPGQPIVQQLAPQITPQQPMQLSYAPTAIEEIEELVESVVEEKWRSFMESFGDITVWKERVRIELVSIKQEVIRLHNSYENLQKAVLGRIQTYDKNIVEIGSEMRALEQVFERIMNPLTSNIKELSRITDELKKKSK